MGIIFQSDPLPGTWSNRQLNFDAKALLKSAKIKLILNFKIFFSYTLCYWIICIKYKNEGITKIPLVNDFDHVTNKFFVSTKKS